MLPAPRNDAGGSKAGPGQNESEARAFTTLVYDPKFRSYFFQIVAIVCIVGLFIFMGFNVARNLAAANQSISWSFINQVSSFDISFSLIDYSRSDTYARAFLVGLLNTIFVAVVGIFFATVIGFMAGIGRLSKNWLVSRISTVYIETLRNVPLLLQMFVWYLGIFVAFLPHPRNDGIAEILPNVFLSNRGLYFPRYTPLEGFGFVIFAVVFGIIVSFFVARWAKARLLRTGQLFPVLPVNLGLIFILPVIVFFVVGSPIQSTPPEVNRFGNIFGATKLSSELIALVVALSTYTSTYIAEIVRGGILAVDKGQTEAADSLGLKRSLTLRLVIIPQAMRVIIPPLTNQYLNLTKNSSLAIAIAFPDLVAVYTGITLNQTGQSILIVLTTMLIYLILSLVTAFVMNNYNKRKALVER